MAARGMYRRYAMMRWGIVGAGGIARRFAASLAHVEGAELVAASRRTREAAEAFLAEVPAASDARAYGSHDELIADEGVDAVYVALPHSLHAAWSIRALETGKAVLSEKPAAISVEETRAVSAAARAADVLYMEALKTRFVPLHERIMAALPRLGRLQRVEATLCNDAMAELTGSGTYHLADGPGAGALLDCGIYCAGWIEELMSGPWEVTDSVARLHGSADVYSRTAFQAGSVTAVLECAFDEGKPRQLTVLGERGRLVVEELHRPQRGVLELTGSAPEVLAAPYTVDDFYGELMHFRDLYRAGLKESPLMPWAASIRCAELLDLARARIFENRAG